MDRRCTHISLRAVQGVRVQGGAALVLRMEVREMPFVIAEPCIDVRDRACVGVCPVACIQFEAGKDRKLYIDPHECIDCGACEPACPVEAIYAELDLPGKWVKYERIDALWFQDKNAARALVDEAKKPS